MVIDTKQIYWLITSSPDTIERKLVKGQIYLFRLFLNNRGCEIHFKTELDETLRFTLTSFDEVNLNNQFIFSDEKAAKLEFSAYEQMKMRLNIEEKFKLISTQLTKVPSEASTEKLTLLHKKWSSIN